MSIVARMLAAGLLLSIAPGVARAQSNAAEMLTGAIRLYEDLQVERAVVLLRQVVSPSFPFEVARDQRVQAYKYLGAALAVLGQADSAVVYLRAALERDPFTDMDPQSFSPAERNALAEARARTFAIAVRPVATASLDPRTERVAFTLLSTHAADMRVRVRGAGAGVTGRDSAALLVAEVDGLREVTWNGVLADGRLAPSGRYALVVTGRSLRTERADSARLWFDVRHEHQALEDTLPSLAAGELLPERRPTAVASRDLLRGVGMSGAALLAHVLIGDRRLDGTGRYAGTVAVAGVVAGTAAFILGQRRRDIPANVAENHRRREARTRHNREVLQRNAERLAGTRLTISPAAGAAP